jgi:hypothetical protein
LNPKICFLSSRKYDLGCSSRIRIPDSDFLSILDPGSGSATLKNKLSPGPDSGHEEAGVESVSLGEDLLLDLVDLGLYGLLHLGGADHHAHSATLLQLSQVQLLQQAGKLQ